MSGRWVVVLPSYHGRDVHRPDEVALRAYGHVRLEDVGLGVDRGHLGAPAPDPVL